ncbi:uncharacterized protein F5147DRAFT_654635 [Suillus discolor]|uniref:Uncharacterized protein n=1 Tax=Suillus discolor TaxID=1912936 RepID=A0A9P7JS04_9AGAM|nr:uncharacterized protein F5147DRAFT_654635 [Suillus discolor]KAG2103724.1 hypothetical protein F5147DRAFT_654635 [Suillus discolor]
MTQPTDCHVHFDVPMEGDEVSNPPSSYASDKPQRLDFGFGKPPALVKAYMPAAIQPFNFRFAPTLPPPTPIVLNFGWTPGMPKKDPVKPVAKSFNFGMDTHATNSPLAISRMPMNFGWEPAVHVTTPPAISTNPMNFGWEPAVHDTAPLAISTTPINFGCEPTINATAHIHEGAPTPPNVSTSPPPPLKAAPLNFGWEKKASSMPAPAPHVGYDISNQPFKFVTQGPVAKVGEWTPIPITVASPATSTTTTPTVVPVGYIPSQLPYTDGQFLIPHKPVQDSAGQGRRREMIGFLVADANTAAINIVERLRGDEFNKLVETMLGSLVSHGDDVRDPNEADLLDSNRAILAVFSECRDRLVRTFKDLITLHHTAEHHTRQLTYLESLSRQVENAEGSTTGGS